MSRRPIDPGIHAAGTPGPEEAPDEALEEGFREALARWVTGVTVVAVRDPDDGRVYATTVSSLSSVTARPPRVSFSLGPGAQVLPFLKEGTRFAVNGLAREQRELAVRFTDAFPVGPSPFSSEGDPVVAGAHFVLRCSVERIVAVDGARLVLARVEEAEAGAGTEPLIYHLRDFRQLG